MKKIVITAIIATMILSVSVLGQPNLIVNGDFESPNIDPGWTWFVDGVVPGWTVECTFATGNEFEPRLEMWDNLMGSAYSGD